MDSNSFPNYQVLINGLNPVKWPAPQSLLPENGSIIGTGKISEHISAPKGGLLFIQNSVRCLQLKTGE